MSNNKSTIIALCLFVDLNPDKYLSGLELFIKSRDLYFNKFPIWLYVDDTIKLHEKTNEVVNQYNTLGKIIIKQFDLTGKPAFIKAGARVFALNQDVNVLLRDIDSPLTQLDRVLVDDWLNSDKLVLKYTPIQYYKSCLKKIMPPNEAKFVGLTIDDTGKNKSNKINKLNKKNKLPYKVSRGYMAGGTGIKAEAKIDFDYNTFVAEHPDVITMPQSRGCDELYLYKILNDLSRIEYNVFMYTNGPNIGKWYLEKEKKIPLLNYYK